MTAWAKDPSSIGNERRVERLILEYLEPVDESIDELAICVLELDQVLKLVVDSMKPILVLSRKYC